MLQWTLIWFLIYLQYFVSFLQTNLTASGKCLQYVQWCMDNSNRAQAAPRKLPPSSVEIAVSKQTSATATASLIFSKQLRQWNDLERLSADFSSWMVEQKPLTSIHVTRLRTLCQNWPIKLVSRVWMGGHFLKVVQIESLTYKVSFVVPYPLIWSI